MSAPAPESFARAMGKINVLVERSPMCSVRRCYDIAEVVDPAYHVVARLPKDVLSRIAQ